MFPVAFFSSIKKGAHKGRIYGSAPEAYGTGLQELINLGNWEKEEDLANCYLRHSKWLYNDSNEPIEDINGLKISLEKAEVVLHSQDNREHDLLDSDDYYQFHGGLSSAIEKISGKMPEILFGDNSRRERPRVYKLSKEIDKVMRSRMLNPRWIEGMKKHAYKGAFEMGATLDYLFGYDASTGLVPDWCYSGIYESWLNDEKVKEFLISNKC